MFTMLHSLLLRLPSRFTRFMHVLSAVIIATLFAATALGTGTGIVGCQNKVPIPTEPPSLTEDFEKLSKGSYAAAELALNSGTWLIDNGMIAGESNDQKNGQRALRLRAGGVARMMFDFPNGASVVVLSHAIYGKDKDAATIEVRFSADGGASWRSAGRTNASAGFLQKEAFAVGVTGKVRIEIRRTDDGKSRVNIDDVGIVQSAAAPASGAPTAPTAGNDRYAPAPPNYPHLGMGIPVDTDPSDDYLMQKSQYALSYNNDRRVPNWVSSNLNAEHFGDVPRFSGKFMPDAQLPAGFYRVRHEDYSNSGYDRGHMVRSEERTDTPANNMATFLTTNLLPQYHELNAGPWLRLEELCQRFAQRSNKELYIICGGIFSKTPATIGRGGVAVPDQCFKIVVVLERGQSAKDVTTKTTVLAAIMPNRRDVAGENWRKYAVSVDAIERATGYDFLTAVPVEIQRVIEAGAAGA
jgi:endonuclease G, mitochondrial